MKSVQAVQKLNASNKRLAPRAVMELKTEQTRQDQGDQKSVKRKSDCPAAGKTPDFIVEKASRQMIKTEMTGAERFNSCVHVLPTSFLTRRYRLMFYLEVITMGKSTDFSVFQHLK